MKSNRVWALVLTLTIACSLLSILNTYPVHASRLSAHQDCPSSPSDPIQQYSAADKFPCLTPTPPVIDSLPCDDPLG